jgi:hypothetical protein
MPGMLPRRRIGRKLLVASIGVASVSYVACGSTDISTPTDAGSEERVVGNLAGPDGNFGDHNPPPDAVIEDAPLDQLVANLIAPPFDAGLE